MFNSIYENPKYRIKRNSEYQEMMLKLINAKIFGQYKDILMLSAVVGLLNKCPEPITKNASDSVQMTVFDEKDKAMINMIAFSASGDASVVSQDKKYEIFESYANGGFSKLLELLEIDDETEFTPEIVKSKVTKLFMLVVSKGFSDGSTLTLDDILL